MPKIRSGEKISWKDFMKRWKRGIDGITQMQQTKMQIQSVYIIILGLLCGITICLFNIGSIWWLMIILIGGLYNSSVQLIALYQKKSYLKYFEEIKDNVQGI